MTRFRYARPLAYLLFITLSVGIGLDACQSNSTPPSPTLTAQYGSVQALPNSTTFFAMGDWGVYGQFHQQLVADQMEAYAAGLKPSWLIMAGDNFYTQGVRSITDSHWLLSYQNVYTGAHLPPVFYVALGNHDYQQNVQAQLEYGLQHPRWQLPGRYYTQRIAINNQSALRLVVIDTNPFVEEYRQNTATFPDILQNTGKQLRWLDSVLANAREPWTMVVGHHPLYSVGRDHGNQAELLQQIGPLLQKYGVQLYLCGHSHTLQHLPRVGTTDFVISGGGGAPLGSIADSTRALFARASGGFAVFSINADSLRMSFVNSAGQRLYSWQRAR